MGRGSSKAKAKKRKVDPFDYIRPTEQREAHNDTASMGMAVRIVPVIETLLLTKKLTQAEFDVLNYYRDQASRAEDDVAQEGTLAPSRIMGGHTAPCGGKIPAILLATPAILETARIERDLGSLLPIARAIAVDDWTLTRWCIEQHGATEKWGKGKNAKGEVIDIVLAMIPNNQQAVEDIARLELRMAARRISR